MKGTKVKTSVIKEYIYDNNLSWTELASKLKFSANYTRDVCMGDKPLSERFANAIQRIIGKKALVKSNGAS